MGYYVLHLLTCLLTCLPTQLLTIYFLANLPVYLPSSSPPPLQEVSAQDPSLVSRYCLDTLPVYGQEKYLVLQDIDVHAITDVLMPSDVKCDVAALLYDASCPKSFEYVARIYLVSCEPSIHNCISIVTIITVTLLLHCVI